MELSNVKGIGPAKQAKLEAAGVRSVEELAHCDVTAVATSSGYSIETVRELKQRAAALALLQDIKGVGPATVQTLAQQGIQSLKDFYEASSERLAYELKVAQGKVQKWQAEARDIAARIAEDAKTPEGRKKLMDEGMDFAQKAAQVAKETAERAVERARKDRDTIALKVKEIQDKAPDYIREYQEKTEKILKETEARIKDLTEKAQASIRHEAEKVKAANEGFLARVRSRFEAKKKA